MLEINKIIKEKILLGNIFSLYIVHFANFILPLIIIPYIVRVLGPEKYGIIAISQGFISYFVLIVNFGFDWSATRTISVHRLNKYFISNYVYTIWLTKLLLFILMFIIIILCIQIIPRINDIKIIVLILTGIILGNVLMPTWLYQGLEKLTHMAAINLIIRILITLSIFLFVINEADYIIYALLLSMQWILSGFITALFALRYIDRYKLNIVYSDIIGVLKDSWILFISNASTSLYTIGNSFLLGMLTNNIHAGYYDAAERIIRAIKSIYTPLQKAIYPRFAMLANKSKNRTLKFGKKVLFVNLFIGMTFFLFILVFTEKITLIILGQEFLPSIIILKILAPILLFVAISNVLGIQIMISFGYDKAFTSILFISGLINILLIIILVPHLKSIGMAIAVSSVEFLITLMMILYLKKKKLNILL